MGREVAIIPEQSFGRYHEKTSISSALNSVEILKDSHSKDTIASTQGLERRSSINSGNINQESSQCGQGAPALGFERNESASPRADRAGQVSSRNDRGSELSSNKHLASESSDSQLASNSFGHSKSELPSGLSRHQAESGSTGLRGEAGGTPALPGKEQDETRELVGARGSDMAEAGKLPALPAERAGERTGERSYGRGIEVAEAGKLSALSAERAVERTGERSYGRSIEVAEAGKLPALPAERAGERTSARAYGRESEATEAGWKPALPVVGRDTLREVHLETAEVGKLPALPAERAGERTSQLTRERAHSRENETDEGGWKLPTFPGAASEAREAQKEERRILPIGRSDAGSFHGVSLARVSATQESLKEQLAHGDGLPHFVSASRQQQQQQQQEQPQSRAPKYTPGVITVGDLIEGKGHIKGGKSVFGESSGTTSGSRTGGSDMIIPGERVSGNRSGLRGFDASDESKFGTLKAVQSGRLDSGLASVLSNEPFRKHLASTLAEMQHGKFPPELTKHQTQTIAEALHTLGAEGITVFRHMLLDSKGSVPPRLDTFFDLRLQGVIKVLIATLQGDETRHAQRIPVQCPVESVASLHHAVPIKGNVGQATVTHSIEGTADSGKRHGHVDAVKYTGQGAITDASDTRSSFRSIYAASEQNAIPVVQADRTRPHHETSSVWTGGTPNTSKTGNDNSTDEIERLLAGFTIIGDISEHSGCINDDGNSTVIPSTHSSNHWTKSTVIKVLKQFSSKARIIGVEIANQASTKFSAVEYSKIALQVCKNGKWTEVLTYEMNAQRSMRTENSGTEKFGTIILDLPRAVVTDMAISDINNNWTNYVQN